MYRIVLFASPLRGGNDETIRTPMINILFLCTGNSARSILAEAMSNDLSIGRGRFRAFSAGSHPRGTIHPLTLDVLREHLIATDGLRSKSWEEFAGPAAPAIDVVITVCDAAAAEPCPLWPGRPTTAHWSVSDPAAVTGSDDERRRAFRDAFFVLRRRVELFASLPFDALTRRALQERLEAIGKEPLESPR